VRKQMILLATAVLLCNLSAFRALAQVIASELSFNQGCIGLNESGVRVLTTDFQVIDPTGIGVSVPADQLLACRFISSLQLQQHSPRLEIEPLDIGFEIRNRDTGEIVQDCVGLSTGIPFASLATNPFTIELPRLRAHLFTLAIINLLSNVGPTQTTFDVRTCIRRSPDTMSRIQAIKVDVQKACLIIDCPIPAP
jgi:hypothetical protein